MDKEADSKYFNKPFLEIGTDEEKATFAAWEKEVYQIEENIRKREDMVTGDGDADPELKALREKLNAHRKARPKLLRTMVMKELPEPRVSYIHLGGDFTRKGAVVKPGVLGVSESVRDDLAESEPARFREMARRQAQSAYGACDRQSHVAEILRKRDRR